MDLHMEHYFLANEMTSSDKQRAVLTSAMGAKSYKLLRNLITLKAPSNKSFKEIVKAMMMQFYPSSSEIVQRLKFNTHVRKPGESVANYVAELQALSQNCNFRDTLKLMLSDKIVSGINGVQTQKRLLVEKYLSFAKANKRRDRDSP